MHDAAPKIVYDDPDAPAPLAPMPAIGRVSTEDLVAHVIVDGARHRRTPDLRETACGDQIHSQFVVPLREALTLRDGDMCPRCFTPHEMLRAMQNDADAIDAAEEEQKKRDAADAERKSKRWKTPSQGDR